MVLVEGGDFAPGNGVSDSTAPPPIDPADIGIRRTDTSAAASQHDQVAGVDHKAEAAAVPTAADPGIAAAALSYESSVVLAADGVDERDRVQAATPESERYTDHSSLKHQGAASHAHGTSDAEDADGSGGAPSSGIKRLVRRLLPKRIGGSESSGEAMRAASPPQQQRRQQHQTEPVVEAAQAEDDEDHGELSHPGAVWDHIQNLDVHALAAASVPSVPGGGHVGGGERSADSRVHDHSSDGGGGGVSRRPTAAAVAASAAAASDYVPSGGVRRVVGGERNRAQQCQLQPKRLMARAGEVSSNVSDETWRSSTRLHSKL